MIALTIYTDRTQWVHWGHIGTVFFGQIVKVLEIVIAMYSVGNLVGLWGVLYKCNRWVLGGVNCMYFTKDIKPYLLGLLRVV